MGSGIAQLLIQYLPEIQDLVLIDPNIDGLKAIPLREQLRRFAEKQINLLRQRYANDSHLISNAEIIEAFIQDTLTKVRRATTLHEAAGATLIFEAVIEDIDLKAKLLSQIRHIADPDALFLSNTSSLPIHLIDQKAQLNHRILGFHFYNPPVVQKLLELIVPTHASPSDITFAEELIARLEKICVRSADVAGFIGNGLMLREIKFGCNQVRALDHPVPTAIFLINHVTQHYLMRPMGVFQLLDYVGIDVVHKIAGIMEIDESLIEEMVDCGILGGQYPDGSQKDGFFKYESAKISGIWNGENYAPIDTDWEALLGTLPEDWISWKGLKKNRAMIDQQLQWIGSDSSEGAQLARAFLQKDAAIADRLVSEGVAENREAIDTVLQNGFYHLYGVQSHERV